MLIAVEGGGIAPTALLGGVHEGPGNFGRALFLENAFFKAERV